jgi:hypothetical protein
MADAFAKEGINDQILAHMLSVIENDVINNTTKYNQDIQAITVFSSVASRVGTDALLAD